MQNIIAIICDCDDTLAPDTTSFLLEQNNIKPKPFWDDIKKTVEQGWDPPLAWMTKILTMMESKKIKQNTNQELKNLGKQIPLYRGVPEFIPQLKQLIKEKEFIKARIELEFYIISSGIEDLIQGSILSVHFKEIFAGQFNQKKKIDKIKSIVTFTEKTKFLFAINKGITKQQLRQSPYDVNQVQSIQQRRIPFQNMIYIGDGPSDIPCFSTISKLGGQSIGVSNKDSIKKGYELAKGNRITAGPFSPDYEQNSDLRNTLDTMIKDIAKNLV